MARDDLTPEETVFYTMRVYFLAAKVMKPRHTLTRAPQPSIHEVFSPAESYLVPCFIVLKEILVVRCQQIIMFMPG